MSATKRISILKRNYSYDCSSNTPVPLCSGNMETSDRSKNKPKEPHEDPAPPGPSQDSQHVPSPLELDLKKAQTQAKNQNEELASQYAALKEQMAAKELSWEQERKKLMKALESARANQNQTHLGRKIKQKEKEIRSLHNALHEQEVETQRVTQYWKGEYDRVTSFWKEENDRITLIWENETKAIKAASDKNLMDLNAEWEERWHVRQEELGAQIKTLQEETDKKVSQVILEKDDLISKIPQEKTSFEARCAESSAKLEEKEQELLQSQAEMNRKADQGLQDVNSMIDLFVREINDFIIKGMNDQRSLYEELNETSAKLDKKEMEIILKEAKWRVQFKTLEGQLKCEVAEKEAGFERMQELERKHSKEEEVWLHKVIQMEEDIQLLTQRHTELQELVQMTDKQRAKIRKEAKKAQKEAEKTLKKEREEQDKKDKERLKREKKEQREREKKEKESNKVKWRWRRGD
ncbi:golgin subfamily A member 6-like protein 22 [Anabas testudineus]|uniref:golgin subfamily A member 6-like protein 22 n=1 Tax=Anabas testudineus TaxID=64144 RepID=UPI000E459C85|nr:golgin subfamily A member 6-like protein 22 [Anabas testudineus]